jgi:hypothetical protein
VNRLQKLKGLKTPAVQSVEQTQQLRRLGEELRDGVQELEELGTAARDVHARVLNRVRLLGTALIQAKKLKGHGRFLPWLEVTLPNVSTRTCQNWMRAARWSAENAQRFALLESVSQLYCLAGIIPEAQAPEVRSEPAFSLAIAMRYVKPLGRLSVDQALRLPVDEQQALRSALEPAVNLYAALHASTPPAASC